MCASPAVTPSEQPVCLKRELHVTNERQQAASGSFPPQKKNAWSLILNLHARRCAAEKRMQKAARERKPETESKQSRALQPNALCSLSDRNIDETTALNVMRSAKLLQPSLRQTEMSLSLHFKTVCVRRGTSAKPAISSPPADCILHRVLWEAPLPPQKMWL